MSDVTFIVWDPALEDRLWLERTIDFDAASSIILDNQCRRTAIPGFFCARDEYLLSGVCHGTRREVICHCRQEHRQLVRILDACWADEFAV